MDLSSNSHPAYLAKIDLSDHVKLIHRSGWDYAISSLRSLHSKDGVWLADFIEKPFAWNYREASINKTIPYIKSWIGIIHNPPNTPLSSSNQQIFSRKEWQQSLPYCSGLFTLSKYHRDFLNPLFDFPVVSLYHPTETPELKFTFESFSRNNNKQVIHVGWWLRNFESFYRLKVSKLKKLLLHSDLEKLAVQLNKKTFENSKADKNLKKIPRQSNADYDKLLSENIVFIDLHDSSANNTIIECIVRNTPILVNPLPAVKEYLGNNYPFYFSSIEEAQNKAENFDLIKETYDYLVTHPIKEKLTQEYFLKSFAESEIYEGLLNH